MPYPVFVSVSFCRLNLRELRVGGLTWELTGRECALPTTHGRGIILENSENFRFSCSRIFAFAQEAFHPFVIRRIPTVDHFPLSLQVVRRWGVVQP